jgi:transposase
LTIAVEVCDFRRFPTAPSFMGFCGLVPREYSSGDNTWRGKITKAGNVHVRTQLVESAWAYRFHPNVSANLRRRQQGVDPGCGGAGVGCAAAAVSTLPSSRCPQTIPIHRHRGGRPRARRVRVGRTHHDMT